MPSVVNFKDFGSIEALKVACGNDWLYIGRTNPRSGLSGSPLANPYRIDDRTDRETAVELYKQYLWARIKKGETAVLEELRKIGENTAIVCWCAPQACHGDVVVKAAAWLRERDFTAGEADNRLAQPKVMNAISLWQPWAQLMALGLKQFETRSWATGHRGQMAIHAAKRKINWREVHPFIQDVLAEHGFAKDSDFPYGAIVGMGNLTGCYRVPDDGQPRAYYTAKSQVYRQGGMVVATAPTLSDGIVIPPPEPELYYGNYQPGRYAWHMPDVKAIKPVECKGSQRIWTVPEESAALARGRYQRAMAVAQGAS